MQTLPAAGVPLHAPQCLGPYQLERVLGRGGSGVVYCAVGPDGAPVAIKTPSTSTPLALACLRAELHALRRVRHDGIVRVLDDGVDAGRPWFAMELLRGETVADFARRETRASWTSDALRPVLELVRKLCAPLAALHDGGIVHRDLKPDNLFIRVDGTPVIMDLGLARGVAPGATRAIVEADVVAGTYAYMAPEQRTNQLVDARTDLYALGCILFELLVGTPPGGHEAPSRFVHGIPPELDTLVVALLQPRARDRIGHADDVRDWLASIHDSSQERVTQRRSSQRLYRPMLSGRGEVVRELLDGLRRVRAGRCETFVIEGESGIGKTHLISEIGRVAVHDCAVLPVVSERADSIPRTPLASWALLFEYAMDRVRLAASSPVANAVERHRALLVGLHQAFAVLDTTRFERDSRPSVDQVIVALGDLVGAISDERPVVMLFDDLQWADELTLGALRYLAGRWGERRRVLLLATVRSEDPIADRLGRDMPRAQRMRLGPLPDADVRELVADMLGVGEPPDSVVAWISQHAEGNPYLAGEYLRLVVSELPLERELALPIVRVRAPHRDRLEQLPTPRSVHELVMRRIDRLDETSRELAELAAVLGGTIDVDVTVVLETEHRDAMFELHRLQVLERTNSGGCRLLHDRMRKVVYDQLSDELRIRLHDRAARLLVRASSGELPHGAIGRHFVISGQRTEALPHLEHAAELALSRAAYDASARHFDEAREIATEVAVHGVIAPRAHRARLGLGAARARYGLGDMDECEGHVRDVLALVGRELPHERTGWMSVISREIATRFVPRLAGRSPDPVLADAALAASILPYRYFFEEDLLPLIATALLSANLADQATTARPAAGPLSLLAAMAGLFRMPGIARRYFDRAQQYTLSASDWREASASYALESIYQGSFARWDEAENCARKAVEYSVPMNDPWLRVNAETTYAHVEYFTGRFEDAHRRAILTEQLAGERGNVQHAVWGHYLQARSDIPRGRWALAESHLEAALRGLESQPEPISEVACSGMMARVRYAAGSVFEAERYAQRVLTLVKARVAPAYPSLIGYVTSARILASLVEREPTQTHWRQAREIGVALWRFAAIYPVAIPAASLHLGTLFKLAGWARLAYLVYKVGARRAERSRQPYEHAQLLVGAAATARDATISQTLCDHAATIGGAIGCDARELHP